MQRSLGGLDLVGELLIVLAIAIASAVVARLVAGPVVARLGPWAADERRLDRIAWGAIGLLMAAYLGTIGALSLARHQALKSHAYDLGIFDQVLWNTSQGRWFQNTVMIEYAENLLGQHFAPIFLLLVPLYWIWPDAKALLLLQSVALASAAIPVYLLARHRIGSRFVAVVLAAAYLVTPAVHFVNFYDFHEIALVTPILLFALYFLDTRRTWPLLLCLGLALLCREEVSIIVAAFGLALLVQRRWRLGVPLIALGAAWLYLTVVVLVPYYQESPVYYFVVRYGKLGDTIPQILMTIVTRPHDVVAYLATGDRAWDRAAYLVRLFAPVGMLGPAGLPFFALSLPTFGYLLLSDYKEQYDIVNQYSAPLLPFIFGGTILTIGWLRRTRFFGSPQALAGLAVYVLAAAIVSTIQFGPVGRRFDAEQFTMTDHTRLGHRIMAMIPPTASVSTQSDLVPHLAHRREIYVFPYLHNAEYVLVDNWTDRWPLTTPQWDIARDELVATPLYTLIHVEDGYGLFKRVEPPPIQQSLYVSYLDKIALIGLDLPKKSVKPGETIEVGLYWKALTPIGVRRIRDRFVTFLHLVTPDGKPIHQVDKEPLGGLTQTDRWIQGEIHRERYLITVPADLPPGEYGLDAGLYSFYSKRRLAIFDEAGQRTEQFAHRAAVLSVER